MKLLVPCTALLCLLVPATAQKDLDIKAILGRIKLELLGGTFTARAEATYAERGVAKATYSIAEYHDGSSGMHSLEVRCPKCSKEISSVRKFYNQNLKTGQVVSVNAELECQVQNVSDAAAARDPFVFKSRDALEPEYFLGPSAIIVEMPMDGKWEATPGDNVRGIRTYVYSNLDSIGAEERTIYVSFAVNWELNKLSRSDVPFPVRVTIEHKDNVTYLFDFYQVEDLLPEEAFRLGNNLQLPFGTTGCKLPESQLKPAVLGTAFSFTSAVNGDLGGQSTKEYFSLEDRLYRADGADGRTVIHDDTHGLIYSIGNGCEARPNEDFNKIALSSGSTNPGARVIQAYQSFSKKVYIGEGFVRGIPVDIWDAEAADGNFKRARFFFAKSFLVISANGNTMSQPLLKAMILDSLDHDDVLDVDIYDFVSSTGDLDFRKNFNIEDCVEASMFIEIVYQVPDNKTFNIEEFKYSNAPNELIESAEEAIRESVAISPLQLPSFKAEVVDERTVKVYAKVLAPPPYHKSFTIREEPVKHYKGPSRSSSNAEDCARECIGKKCPTFLLCGENTCQLMNSTLPSGWGDEETLSEKDCYVYDHVAVDEDRVRKSLDQISYFLERLIMLTEPEFKPKISVGQGVSVVLQANKFYGHLTQFNKQGTLGPYMRQFESTSIDETHQSSLAIGNEVVTSGECYRECRANKDLACSSFSICTASKKCVLSSLNINAGTNNHPDQKTAIKGGSADCTVYSVNYLSEFDRLDGKVRKKGNSVESKASTAGECAKTCRQDRLDGLKECRSFDFCSKNGKCYYYPTHFKWVGEDEALKDDTGCDHYALRYSASYTASSKGSFPGKPSRKVEGVDFEECAKRCSEHSNNECQTISYCDSDLPNKQKQACYMYAETIGNLGASDREHSCTVYTKDESLVNEIINPNRQFDAEKGFYMLGMGNGAFAVLLIAMLVIGAVLGATGYLQRDRILALMGRSDSSSPSRVETSIAYSRQDDDNNRSSVA
ncbi:uncharacterized protein LOC100904263 [Galendromus occidentalis]|uniref:Uncharacterized protein LOC100904263 n=1 Tax=Galendromus occidentalis TaxID=34638 RepID=A0AAJ6QQQ9_9ACAR|nr:uncharacterized protein LOC100904263 [Galendromus occidentalis]